MKSRKRRERRYRASSLAYQVERRLPRPRVEIDRGLAWYVVWVSSTRFSAEKDMVRRLSERGLPTYHPIEAISEVKRGKRMERERPALGRYIFVGLDAALPRFDLVHDAVDAGRLAPALSLGRVLSVYDAEREVSVPLRVPASALQRLVDGLSCFEAAGPFAPGSRCRAVSGAFSGLLAEVESADDYRVRALVNLFGGQVRAEFEPSQLEAA